MIFKKNIFDIEQFKNKFILKDALIYRINEKLNSKLYSVIKSLLEIELLNNLFEYPSE